MYFLSPQSFLFSSFYFFLLFIMFSSGNFFVFWVVIELRTLVFMGVAYSIFKNNFTSLLVFFIIQSLSAFSLILFYFISSSLGFTVSLILKLSIFPFFYWYLNLIPNFTNFIFFFSRTAFKLPSVFIIINFYFMINFTVLFLSSVITVIAGALLIIYSRDLRFILICSSVVNNSWFLFRQYVSSLYFLAYFLVYSLALLYLLFITNNQFSYVFAELSASNNTTMLCLFTIAGLPPFPIFFIKITLICYLVVNFYSSVFIFFLILLRVITILGYLKFIFRTLVNSNTMYLSFLL